MKYVIEHLEPELYEWCIIEYRHISETVGKENLIFTNVKKDKEKLEPYGDVKEQSAQELNLSNPCLLDMDAEKQLSKDDDFDYLVFGGILGDHPPQQRTMKHFSAWKKETRNLGDKQMSTDTAVKVAKLIADGADFNELKFQDEIEIPTAEGESVIFPFRYLIIENKPFISKELIEYLKKKQDF
ncbi:hypothetical protein KY311_02255 [Candidatus Woesearchaeota archaeon]|nr:hypothetical protein [Candidatus Woesearchaeota archaeon]